MDLDTVIVALGTGPNPIIQRSAQAEGMDIVTDKKVILLLTEKQDALISLLFMQVVTSLLSVLLMRLMQWVQGKKPLKQLMSC